MSVPLQRTVAVLSLIAITALACAGGESVATFADEPPAAPTTQPAVLADEPQAQDASVGAASAPAATPEQRPPDGRGVIFDGGAGAEEAGEAVRRLLAAINSGDVLGALAYIEPSERDLIADLYLTAVEAAEAAWPQFGGHDAIGALETEVLALTPLRTQLYNDHLAWVETDEVEFYMAAPTEVATSFFNDSEPWGEGSPYTRADIAIREDSWSEFSYLFGGSSDVLPGFMVTAVDGRWYVSFGRTMLELLRVDAGYAVEFPERRVPLDRRPAPSPEIAVVDFLTALADDRMTDAAALLVPGEARALGDYPGMLERWLPGLLDLHIELDATALGVFQLDADRAVVEVTSLALSVTGLAQDEGVFDQDDPEFSHSLALDDACLHVNEEPVWCDVVSNSATRFTSFYNDLGWEGLRLVAVQSDGGWLISVYDSIGHYGIPIFTDPLHGLGYSQVSESIGEGPLVYSLINETAKTMPVQTSDSITLESRARGRLLIARIESAHQGRQLFIDPALLGTDCFVTIWNTDMVANDWGEEPDYYDDEECHEYFDRPIVIPAGVELALTVWSAGESLDPIVAELR